MGYDRRVELGGVAEEVVGGLRPRLLRELQACGEPEAGQLVSRIPAWSNLAVHLLRHSHFRSWTVGSAPDALCRRKIPSTTSSTIPRQVWRNPERGPAPQQLAHALVELAGHEAKQAGHRAAEPASPSAAEGWLPARTPASVFPG